MKRASEIISFSFTSCLTVISTRWVGRTDTHRAYNTEIMDFGYPQNFDTDVLKLYITQKGEITEGKVTKLLLVTRVSSYKTLVL